MKYGLLTYEEDEVGFNVGDNIQSLAAKQYLPKVDTFINREKLAAYKGEKTKLIMNGWFTHNLKDWLPSKDILPFFVSFHINEPVAKYLLNDESVNYLKNYEPIGCRDNNTVRLLKDKGVDAFHTSCLTLTLDSYKVDDSERNDNIYIVDPLYGYPTKQRLFKNYKYVIKNILNGKFLELGKRKKHLNKIIDKELLRNAVYVTQVLPPKKYSDQEKFEIADETLKKYAKAKLVITSRIHCALPCLAMGTPVIFINGFSDILDTSRFDGLIDLFNRIDVDTKTGEWTANFPIEGKINSKTMVKNLDNHIELARNLKQLCRNFINE